MADRKPNAAPATPRDAATLALLRADPAGGEPLILMGQRGGGASFMPSKVVFPGGAVDPEDRAQTPERALSPRCRERLSTASEAGLAEPLAMAAIRETFEETGLRLAHLPEGATDSRPTAPETQMWEAFLADGAQPALDRLRFFFRAVTPPALPKRFDARFFLASAQDVLGDPDDFSRASGELTHLAWTPLSQARTRPLPFVTNIVIVELAAAVKRIGLEALLAEGLDRSPPFFRHDESGAHVDAL